MHLLNRDSVAISRWEHQAAIHAEEPVELDHPPALEGFGQALLLVDC